MSERCRRHLPVRLAPFAHISPSIPSSPPKTGDTKASVTGVTMGGEPCFVAGRHIESGGLRALAL